MTSLNKASRRIKATEYKEPEKRYSLSDNVQYKYLKFTDRYIFACNLEDALRDAAQRNFVMPLVEEDVEEETEFESSSTTIDLFSESSKESLESSEPEPELDLQTCTTREYIDNTVGPVVLLALTRLERERPEDPIEFLAEYLLHYKNDQDKEERRKQEFLDINDPFKYYKQVRKVERI